MVCPVEFATFWILLIAKKNSYLLELCDEVLMDEIHKRGGEEEIGHVLVIFQAE